MDDWGTSNNDTINVNTVDSHTCPKSVNISLCLQDFSSERVPISVDQLPKLGSSPVSYPMVGLSLKVCCVSNGSGDHDLMFCIVKFGAGL